MKKIAIFINELKFGGIEKSAVNMIYQLNKKKYEVDLYVFGDAKFFEVPDSTNVIRIKKSPFFLKFIPFKLAYELYNPHLPNEEYDVAIDFDSYQLHTAVAALKIKAKMRCIWVHNDIPIKMREERKYKILYFFFKKKYDFFDAICAVSQGAMDAFKKLHFSELQKYYVIPNYINTEEIKKKMKENCHLKVNDSLINIVTNGRLCHQKGIDIMLTTMKELTKYRTDFHLYIIGDGEERKNLEKITQKLNLIDKVTFLGSQRNPYQYLKCMDLFYLASRYEGQGMVLLEAKSIGLDVLFPKYLEKYCPFVEGTTDILKFLKTYKKQPKKTFDSLIEYNENITQQLDKLFKEIGEK